MKLHTMQDVEQALAPYYQVAAETTGRGITVERTEKLMAHLGNPEAGLRVVHIAGTSGKTSTTYHMTSLLTAAGQKVGSTVSPHVDSLTERVQINGRPLAEPVFCAAMSEFLDLIRTADEKPSWFELMIAFALWVFARERVDFAVLETGLGGLHDATNVANRPDKVCIITDISYDHMEILGHELPQIASQKAGIIHPGNVVFMYEQVPEVMQVVRFKVSQTPSAELYQQDQHTLAGIYGDDFSPGFPDYQKRNWLLAYGAYRYLVNRDNLPLLSPAELLTTQTVVPARMEAVKAAGKIIIMDGAHNEAKMQAFADSFVARFGNKKVPVLIALKKNKKQEGMTPLLAKFASEIIVTGFHVSQDWPIMSQEPEELASTFRAAGLTNVSAEPDLHTAFTRLLASSSEVVVVTGSFYLISELRKEEKLQ